MIRKYIVLSFLCLSGFSFQAFAAESFPQWLEGVKREARSKGVSSGTIEAAFEGVKPIPRIIELDRKQPEGKFTFAQYRERVITKARIAQGRRLYWQNKALLDQVSEKYGVQPQYIVALWGIETSYGNNTGGFRVVEALATLAHDGRRSEFFRAELMDALKILDEGHISHAKMKGSWAGAMGQNQFMPSSFFKFAVDGNGDGKRDIWTTRADVFASTANYLSRSGWRGDERWGRAVRLPSGFNPALEGKETVKTLSEWSRLGVQLPGGGALPHVPGFKASVVAPDGVNGPAFLVYDNFRTTLKWNKSTYFALSVGLLADAIAG